MELDCVSRSLRRPPRAGSEPVQRVCPGSGGTIDGCRCAHPHPRCPPTNGSACRIGKPGADSSSACRGYRFFSKMEPGLPATTFSAGFDFWPPRQMRRLPLYFQQGGRLERRRPSRRDGVVDGFRPDPSLRPSQTIPGQEQSASWALQPDYNWTPLPAEAAVAYRSEVLSESMVLAGTASVDLWLRSSAPDTDLQVTLSEIRSDGVEVYIQNGCLRASHRAMNRRTRTPLDPAPTHLEADAEPLPSGEFSYVRVGILPFPMWSGRDRESGSGCPRLEAIERAGPLTRHRPTAWSTMKFHGGGAEPPASFCRGCEKSMFPRPLFRQMHCEASLPAPAGLSLMVDEARPVFGLPDHVSPTCESLATLPQ